MSAAGVSLVDRRGHHLRVSDASDPTDPTTCCDLAERVAAQARPGEQVEAYVARGTTTQVQGLRRRGRVAHLGDVVGHRHPGGRRPPAGLRPRRHASTTTSSPRPWPRPATTPASASADEWFGLAEPDGVAPVDQDLWRDGLAAFDPAAKVELALALERAVLGRDPRVTGVRTATYADSSGEGAVATSTGMPAWGRGTSCWLSVSGPGHRRRRDQDRRRASTSVASPASSTSRWRRPTRSSGPCGSSAPDRCPSQRLSIVLEPRMAASILALAGGTLTGERVLKGRSPFADRLGEAIASPLLTLVDDPTNPASLAADSHDGEGLACRRNPLIVDGVLQQFLHNSYTARRAGTASTGSAARGYRSTPGVACGRRWPSTPGQGTLDELIAGVELGLLVDSMSGFHSGVNAGQRRLLGRGRGPHDPRRPGGEPVREVTIASTLPAHAARHRGRRRRPRVAPLGHRLGHPGHRRHLPRRHLTPPAGNWASVSSFWVHFDAHFRLRITTRRRGRGRAGPRPARRRPSRLHPGSRPGRPRRARRPARVRRAPPWWPTRARSRHRTHPGRGRGRRRGRRPRGPAPLSGTGMLTARRPVGIWAARALSPPGATWRSVTISPRPMGAVTTRPGGSVSSAPSGMAVAGSSRQATSSAPSVWPTSRSWTATGTRSSRP